MGVPGFVLRSADTTPAGEILAGTDHDVINHFAPIASRWGGWYVTGAPEDWVHLGNHPAGAEQPEETLTARGIDSTKYPAPGSETLALLVHDHQTHMHNYITRIGFETKLHLAMYGHIRYLRQQTNAFLRYLLFAEESPLLSPLTPNTDFAAAFHSHARRDKQGRSLRDFDLQTRLFKYPCSFLIESEAFQNLPPVAKESLLRGLWEILTNQNQDPAFATISAESRLAILEILRDTLPNLPDYWQADRPH